MHVLPLDPMDRASMLAVSHCRALAFEGKEISARPNDLIASRFERLEILKARIVKFDDLCSAEDKEAARTIFGKSDEEAARQWEVLDTLWTWQFTPPFTVSALEIFYSKRR
ncbi:hypothetical protein GUITHDRAFT_103702 [Guillardia theta CCMP2712]|uniref:Uncharacterized protein n=1 Tax=Guillardia theta (strain CCMP2712) TaxID=905079 RepID=L1JPT7_GUITC|nr:hypothetical protein GUITHDRAFT_103702 [Guillardia theta CCMP2712]EKX50467.1 hypothetical protein GUITHDRAFT_103702 [Guillardia theta CCMP2712]|eukprot:XP_005837447.1 hypothetical protein GUITHDRAFT_103702 [Guillardia theta CCMP2712]